MIAVNQVECELYWEKLVDSLSYKQSSKPAPRRDTAIGHDLERNRIIVFGGRQTINTHEQSILVPVIFDDTWEYDLTTSMKLTKHSFN
jgi:hypothetical protein